MAGLPGTGKSTIAAELARRLCGTVVSKDTIRHTLFDPSHVAYDQQQDDFCAEVGFGVARELLRLDPTSVIILDGRTCSRAYQVNRAVRFSEEVDQPIQIVECVCAEELACSRLIRDASVRRHPAANRDTALYRTLRAEADPIPPPKLTISTNDDLDACVSRCIWHLASLLPLSPLSWTLEPT
jgi:predicted kinase